MPLPAGGRGEEFRSRGKENRMSGRRGLLALLGALMIGAMATTAVQALPTKVIAAEDFTATW